MPERTKLDWTIVGLCAGFVYILAQSAYWEPEIRLLHVFQSLIYVVVSALCLRHSKWGYGAGVSISAFWLLLTTLGTTFLRNGVQEWAHFLMTGEIVRPGVFIAVPAGIDQAGLIMCCVWAYTRLRDRRLGDLLVIGASAAASIGYFVTMMALFRPEFLTGVKHIFMR